MARIARDSTPRRRSARIISNEAQSARKAVLSDVQLESLVESQESSTSNDGEQDTIPATTPTTGGRHKHLQELTSLSTPKTEPRPAREQMHPTTIQQSTAKAPDSGLKLGFTDISKQPPSLASLQNTPSRPRTSTSVPQISPNFQFKFNQESNMTTEGQRIMNTIRQDAIRIKEQMRAELKDSTDSNNQSSSPRKLAQPSSKVGRFSDVHMAQFKKMDSIANHASSFRARPSYAHPTEQSLKRSSSKAGLDEENKSKPLAKSPSVRRPAPILGRPNSISPFKSIKPILEAKQDQNAKRVRLQGDEDVSDDRSLSPSKSMSRLLAPTASSAARNLAAASPAKSDLLARSNSVRSMKTTEALAEITQSHSPSKIPQASTSKPLPPLPLEATSPVKFGLQSAKSSKSLEASTRDIEPHGISKLPIFAGLKSILKSPKKNLATSRPGTPNRQHDPPATASVSRKVDFTPSVKSRYAVKLAQGSPSPAKIDRTKIPDDNYQPYDSAAFAVQYDKDLWENLPSGDVQYPDLPESNQEFGARARAQSRRESKEFKSIFSTTNLDETTNSLTKVNTRVNKSNPIAHTTRMSAEKSVASPARVSTRSPGSSIRKVRNSEPVQPFEDMIETVPHGLPGKKRRIEAAKQDEKYGSDEDAKENRRVSLYPTLPGSFEETDKDGNRQQGNAVEQDEGDVRAGKRARTQGREISDQAAAEVLDKASKLPVVKKSAARVAAAKNARDRKSGVRRLSLSRLNALATPKQR